MVNNLNYFYQNADPNIFRGVSGDIDVDTDTDGW